MLTYDDYLNQIEEQLKVVASPKDPDNLYLPIRYTLEGGGKRLRPVLTLAACEALGGRWEDAIKQAIGLEMFHNFTLLHDDVMDRADMRRGRATVHRRFSESSAILSGDAMLTMAHRLIVAGAANAESLVPQLKLFDKTAMEIYEGQQYDLDFEHRRDVTVDEYMEMIRLKTSVLLGCACAMGAIIANADHKSVNAFYRYGEKLGLAFQLQDDLLDTFGDPIVFGKEIGGDIVCDKKTWLLITALAEDQTGELRHELENPSSREEKISRVIKIYEKLDLPERCRALVDCFVEQAISELNSISMSHPARDFFALLAEQTRRRTH
ncbi:MAG: polyprenyl synthetase family protein [Paramuribaculum sp.]|nr:polyprenyl synthetase family protein [Paramuribaculum sp.]